MDALQLHAGFLGLEQDLWAFKALFANQNFATVRQLIVLLTCVALSSLFAGLIKISHNIAKGLFNVSNNFEFRGSCEHVTFLSEQVSEVLSHVAARKQNALNCMWDCITFEDWHSV